MDTLTKLQRGLEFLLDGLWLLEEYHIFYTTFVLSVCWLFAESLALNGSDDLGWMFEVGERRKV